ncbi:sensor histidine kinase [Desulfonatronum thioautotrophicum]|uniref:sensor histidine kinase n=1 Tax=Desulfonatronum thioautotrophicum TaxID=617001 RepID=UPI00069B260B|nr:ATP-binding protein [Desulfonatronum thioautotrophicum]
MSDNRVPGRAARGILFVWMRGLLLLALLIAALFSTILVRSKTADMMAAADARLLMAVEMLREIVGPDFHDGLDGPESLSDREFAAIVERNNDLCRRLGLQYLWSVLELEEGTLVFTTATHSDIHDPTSPVAGFFEAHRDPASFNPALEARTEPVFSTFHNEWGQGRMVLAPRQDGRGRTYMFGASIQLTAYRAILRDALGAGLMVFTLVMIGAFPVVLVLSRRMIAPISSLTASADRMASGDLDLALPAAGPLEIRSLSRSLDQMRRDLKHQLAALRQSEASLSRANAELRRFAEISAHHLQEPARRLVSFAQRLRVSLYGKISDPEPLQELEFISQSALRLRTLIQDIQLYLAAGAPLGEVRPLDPAPLLQDVLAQHQALIQETGAEILVTDLPKVDLDRSRLTKLFAILVENALAHRRPDLAPRLEVSGLRTSQGATLRIADNGPGIPAEYRERVFEVFERIHSRSTPTGTGIGLAIVRRIVESRGGRVWIEDSDLGGIAVIVELPGIV